MIREDRLVQFLEEAGGVLAARELQFKMSLSDNTIRQAVKIININHERNGFSIEYERGTGYRLNIIDIERYERYRHEARHGFDPTEGTSRRDAILFYLLQRSDYTTIDDLAERTALSRSTLQKDLLLVEDELIHRGLALERRRHYGIRVRGDEQTVRKAFTRFVVESDLYLEPTQDYRAFVDRVNNPTLKSRMYGILGDRGIHLSDLAFENIFEHWAIMLYRIIQDNYIVDDALSSNVADEAFQSAARDIALLTKSMMDIEVPTVEIRYLALGIQSKSTVDTLPVIEKGKLRASIEAVLLDIDGEYQTAFARDGTLIDSLVLHIYPLIMRVNNDFQFKNPLIDEIRADYTNVFTIAVRFCELICERQQLKPFSEDEVGFIALHLAASSEREKRRWIDRVKRIVVICATGAGTASLIKIKLEGIFPQAEIMTSSEREVARFEERLPDLFLSTIPFAPSYRTVPVIQIKNLLDEDELRRIEDVTALAVSHRRLNECALDVLPLFDQRFFQVLPGGSYLDIIEQQAREMVSQGVAVSDYPDRVIKREQMYPTVFLNGVATPHPVKLEAPVNIVGITILTQPIWYVGREVRIIFLVNLRSDSLYLHTELQRLILKIIDNGDLRQRVLSSTSFESFLYQLRKAR